MKYDYVNSEIKKYLDTEVEDVCACSLAAKILGWLSFAQSIEPLFADKCRALLSTSTNQRDIEIFEDAKNYIHNNVKEE